MPLAKSAPCAEFAPGNRNRALLAGRKAGRRQVRMRVRGGLWSGGPVRPTKTTLSIVTGKDACGGRTIASAGKYASNGATHTKSQLLLRPLPPRQSLHSPMSISLPSARAIFRLIAVAFVVYAKVPATKRPRKPNSIRRENNFMWHHYTEPVLLSISDMRQASSPKFKKLLTRVNAAKI